MVDPISGAIAGSIANTAMDQIINYINSSDDPEGAWKRSGLEVAIEAEATYRQEIKASSIIKEAKVRKKMNDLGKIAQQLAIRGEINGFDKGFMHVLEEFGYGCGKFADDSGVLGNGVTESWEYQVKPHVDDIKTMCKYEDYGTI